jgi:hypothetical protein
MHSVNLRQTFLVAVLFLLISIAALWSLNVLSALFGGPELQYKHAVAGLTLLAVLKIGVAGRRTARMGHHDRRAH